jgi:hypothetical protein
MSGICYFPFPRSHLKEEEEEPMSQEMITCLQFLQNLRSVLRAVGCDGSVTVKDIGNHWIVNLGYSVPKEKMVLEEVAKSEELKDIFPNTSD